jgi:NTP pyrophosphatase (non-canonical NTP hydrolase)
MNEVKEILQKLIQFRDDRNWKQFHTPENLAKSLSIEANELLENYQWGDEHADINNIKEEVADIFGYLLLFCEKMKIDLFEATNSKIDKNKKKYPKDKAFCTSKKYTKL